MICISRFDSLYLPKYLLVSGTPMGRTLLWSVRKVGNLSFLTSAIIPLNGVLRGI